MLVGSVHVDGHRRPRHAQDDQLRLLRRGQASMVHDRALASLLEPERSITILVGISAFATVLTVAAPLLQGDQLKARMKSRWTERERLRRRAPRRTSAAERTSCATSPSGTLNQLVDGAQSAQALRGREPRATGCARRACAASAIWSLSRGRASSRPSSSRSSSSSIPRRCSPTAFRRSMRLVATVGAGWLPASICPTSSSRT